MEFNTFTIACIIISTLSLASSIFAIHLNYTLVNYLKDPSMSSQRQPTLAKEKYN